MGVNQSYCNFSVRFIGWLILDFGLFMNLKFNSMDFSRNTK
jgi:hypothetical protein